jgi:hypothetical protein
MRGRRETKKKNYIKEMETTGEQEWTKPEDFLQGCTNLTVPTLNSSSGIHL